MSGVEYARNVGESGVVYEAGSFDEVAYLSLVIFVVAG